jgi:hypothetical protein
VRGSGPFVALMMFMTTVSIISVYTTNRVVIVPIMLLYITVVVVVVSFSVIVSFTGVSTPRQSSP